MPTELHKKIVNAIHRGLRNLEIIDELQDPRGLNLNLNVNDAAEREIENHINLLRREIGEARACAQEAAEEAFRQGKTRKETLAILERPALLASYEVVAYARRAYDAVFGTSQQ